MNWGVSALTQPHRDGGTPLNGMMVMVAIITDGSMLWRRLMVVLAMMIIAMMN